MTDKDILEQISREVYQVKTYLQREGSTGESPPTHAALVKRLDRILSICHKSVTPATNGKQAKDEPAYRDQEALVALRRAVLQQLDNSHFGPVQLAASVGRSPSSVARLLKTTRNETPSQFIRSVRLRIAIRLIREKGYNVSQAAYTVGFSDPGYFTRVFRKTFGKSPTDFLGS